MALSMSLSSSVDEIAVRVRPPRRQDRAALNLLLLLTSVLISFALKSHLRVSLSNPFSVNLLVLCAIGSLAYLYYSSLPLDPQRTGQKIGLVFAKIGHVFGAVRLGGVVCDGGTARGHGGRAQQPEAGAHAQTAQPCAAGAVARVQRWTASAGARAQAAREQRAHPETTAAGQRATKGTADRQLASHQHKNVPENSAHEKSDPLAQVHPSTGASK
ncbi:hypothetical protein KL919_005011 [Ogataea angusta]|nr:hypothetical protein KL943_004855 [Ogataea angusta]KAG7854729.1 hypothetical protein KL919_005011 [Ogataea angusta]